MTDNTNTIKEIYESMLNKGFVFSYNRHSKKLEVTKDNNPLDLRTLAGVYNFNCDELTKYHLSAEVKADDATIRTLLPVPRRHTNKNDIDAYGGNLKAIFNNNSISYAVRDPKTNCWRVLAKNSAQLSSLLVLDEDFIDNKVNNINLLLRQKKFANVNDLPRQLFLYNKECNLGGIFATKSAASDQILTVEYFLDKEAFYNNALVDQYIFTPNSEFKDKVITKQPKVISNNPNEMTLSFFDKNGFIKHCEDTFKDNVPETPNCDSWLEKFEDSDKEIIKDFIWTIFDTDAETAEALWIYDEGGKGKSTFVHFIEKFVERYLKSAFEREMVKACGNSKSESLNNRFNNASIYDKRVVIFPDCKNTKIAKTEVFHQLTGGDAMPVEDKNEKAFSFNANAKVIICSNAYPAVDTGANNEVRRLILVTVKDPFKKLPRVIKDFEYCMLEESEAFLYKCYLSYCDRAARNNGITHVIQTEEDKIQAWREIGDIDTAATALVRSGNITYDEVFEITNNSNDKLSYTDMEFVLARTANGFSLENGTKIKWSFDKRAIKQYLMKDCNLEYINCTVKGKTCRRFIGVKFRKELDEILKSASSESSEDKYKTLSESSEDKYNF